MSTTTYPAITGIGGSSSDVDLTGTVTGVLPLPNGGSGLSNAPTLISTAGNQHNVAVPTSLLVWNGVGGASTITGLVAQTTGAEVTLTNQSNSNIVISHESSSSTAANRFDLPNGSSVAILRGQSMKFVYYGTSSRWVLATFAMNVQSPMGLSGNTISFPAATYGTGSDRGICYFTGLQTVQSEASVFSYDYTLNRMGVGVGTNTQAGVVHAKSDTAQTVGAASMFSATLIEFVLPAEPSSASIAATTPYMAQQSSSTATPNYAGIGYTADNHTIEYRITPGNIESNIWGVASYVATSVDDGSTNPYSVSVSIGGGTSLSVIDQWAVERNIDGGGYNDFQILTNSFLSDDNTGWSGGSPTVTPTVNDFLASGSTYSIPIYGTKTSPIATTIVSINSYSGSYIDANDGSAYRIEISSLVGGDSPFRAGFDASHFNIPSPTGVTIGPDDVLGGAVTVTPNTYGYQANGSVLSISYDYTVTTDVGFGTTIYASSPVNATTTDPNDNLWYYASISGYTPTTGKIVKNGTDGKFLTGAVLLDDGITTFPENTDVTPTSYYAPAAVLETHGNASTDAASAVYKSLDGSYNRIDFLDSNDNLVGIIETDGTDVTIGHSSSGARIQIATGGTSIRTPLTVYGAIDTSAGGTLSIGGSTPISSVLSATATLNFGSISGAGGTLDLTITVTGAAVGDSVHIGLPAAPSAGVVFNAWVSATNTVTVRATNATALSIDPASATYRATVVKF